MFTYNWKMPAVTATGIIFFYQDGKPYFVLAKRADTVDMYPGEYCFPGGFLNPGTETVVEAMRREAREELSIYSNPDDWTMFHVQDTFAAVDPRNEHTVNVCFYNNLSAYAYGVDKIIENLRAADDIGDYKIVPLEEMLIMQMAFDHKEIFYVFWHMFENQLTK